MACVARIYIQAIVTRKRALMHDWYLGVPFQAGRGKPVLVVASCTRLTWRPRSRELEQVSRGR